MLRLLANENIPYPSVGVLRNAGHDVVAVAESAPQAKDEDVLAQAAQEGRWILTFDRDYGELIFGRHLPYPPAVILLRLESYRPEEPGQLLLKVCEKYPLEGFFVTIDSAGIRKRPFPKR